MREGEEGGGIVISKVNNISVSFRNSLKDMGREEKR